MTTSQLIKILRQYPSDTRVFLKDWSEQYVWPCECDTIYTQHDQVVLSSEHSQTSLTQNGVESL